MKQGSDEWFAMRCGRVTASRIADVTAKTKSGPSAMRANYLAQLVAERLTGTVEPSYSNAAMQWGTDTEPMAKNAYSFEAPGPVTEIDFVVHPRLDMSGASPDGLVGDDGLVEIKCPNTATHIATLRGASIDSKYLKQMQWQLACTERQWCDFVSFDPRLPERLQMHVRRVERDEAVISEIEAEVKSFLADVASAVADLERL